MERVLVVGAGIAGLALARAMRMRGMAVEVAEREGVWPVTGAGLYLPGNAVRAIGELGLGAELADRANHVRRQRMSDHRGQLLADIDVDALWDGVAPCMAIHRADMHDILRKATGQVPVALGTSVTGLRPAADAVEVTFGDRTTATYDLVVGADGVHSTVRRLVFGDSPATYAGQVCWRFVATGFDDISDWNVMLGHGLGFLALSLGDAGVYCYGDVSTGRPDDIDADGWRTLFADFADPVPRLLDRAENVHFATIEEVSPPVFTSGRVALIGDAAHASSPNMAQGAAMAIEDALVLAELLDTAGSIDRALADYQRRRADRIAWMQEQTHQRDQMRSTPAPVRNVVLRRGAEQMFRSNYGPLMERP
jgi:2-polyprenyl-6-methoxyphenol hydroxylase-like FAD-dependent oxidoreductase